jgi:hypothetical protein
MLVCYKTEEHKLQVSFYGVPGSDSSLYDLELRDVRLVMNEDEIINLELDPREYGYTCFITLLDYSL